MKFPEWLKPALYGAVAGAVAISITGFGEVLNLLENLGGVHPR